MTEPTAATRPLATRAAFVLGRLRYPRDFAQLAVWRLLGLPRQSWTEIQLVKAALRRQERPRVFEWGLGASTIWYTRWLDRHRPGFEWHGVDHHQGWTDYVASRTDRARVHIAAHPFEWSPDVRQFVPSDARDAYIDAPLAIGGAFDVLIIDGRYRRRCVDVAMRVVAPGGMVLLCEAKRLHYHCSLGRYGGSFVPIGHTPGSVQRNHLAWIFRAAASPEAPNVDMEGMRK
jgi:hypothetical protein